MHLLRRLVALLAASSLLLPASLYAADSTPWYSPHWNYRQKITVNHELVGGSVEGFPMLVRLAGTVFDKAQSDGDDILFTSADGTTKLLHEIESMNGEVVAWVQMPHLSEKEDTTLYVYYGNPTAENQQRPSNVWGNGYAGVWHLNDQPGAKQSDATQNDNDGTTHNMDTGDAQETGHIVDALEFDGSNDDMTAGTSVSGTPELTVSLWVYQHSSGGSVFGKWVGSNTAYDAGFYLGRDQPLNAEKGRVQFYVNENVLTAPVFPYDEWVHAVAVYKSGKGQEIYVNGKREGSEAWSGAVNSHTGIEVGLDVVHGVGLGAHANMDEIRIADTARSSAWIKTEYNNQSGRENFLTIGKPETQSASTTTTSSPSSAFSPLIQAINQLYRTAYDRGPTFSEWKLWADRVLAGDKTTFPELLGAMQWQSLFAE